MMTVQACLYESLAWLGPLGSALASGFAVVVAGEVYLTPAGQRYLDAAVAPRPSESIR